MSLRTRILLLVLAATLLPVLGMLWLLLENRATTVAQAREQLIARTETIANELDDRIAGTTQLLFGLARVPVVSTSRRIICWASVGLSASPAGSSASAALSPKAAAISSVWVCSAASSAEMSPRR